MRLGHNPNKSATVTPFAPIVALVITHLPDLSHPYHSTRFDVIRHSLKSLTDNIHLKPEEYDLIVWDNGSCEEVRDWLRSFCCKLFLSCNIGKTNALKSVMRMLPEGTVLAYGDDDIEYFPNWLAPQLEILRTFPNVGAVTGYPVRITGTWGVGSVKWNPAFDAETGRFLPDEWERDYCDSVGRDYDTYTASTWGVTDYKITYKGVSAYAMSQHCQFVGYPQRLEPLIPWSDRAMPGELGFDRAIDAAGMLRLATVERYTRHLGNVLERV